MIFLIFVSLVFLLAYLALLISCIGLARREEVKDKEGKTEKEIEQEKKKARRKSKLLGLLFILISLACVFSFAFIANHYCEAGKEKTDSLLGWTAYIFCILLSIGVWAIPILGLRFVIKRPG